MTSGNRPPTLSRRPAPERGGSGLPPWLVFVLAIALVFGGYYMYLGARDFIETGGLGMDEATERAQIISTATARSQPTRGTTVNVFGYTPPPTETPIPPCEEFIVSVATAIVRNAPTLRGEVVGTLVEGEIVCVVGMEPNTDWYIIDSNPLTRRLEAVYMRNDLIEPRNPTLTPSSTYTPAPSVTPMPSLTPSITVSPTLSPTRDPRASDTPTPTFTPSPTQPVDNV